MKIKTLIVGCLVTLSLQLNAQKKYYYNETKEFTLVLPGDIYYEANKYDGVLSSETLFNDDLEADLTVWEGRDYNYLPTFSEELTLIANDYGYKEVREFTKGSMSNVIKYEFYIAYSPDDECNVIFGIIQDSYSRKLYEFELFCYNLTLSVATAIINSIQIN